MPDFDPKAYAEAANAEDAPAFDPAAYAAAANSTPPPNVGQFETFANSGANALPLGKQLVDAITALGVKAFRPASGVNLTPQAKAELEGQGFKEEELPGLVELYRRARDEREARTQAGEQQNPITAGLAKGTGVAASLLAPLPKVTVGAGPWGRIASNTLTGGAYGLVNGAAGGRADLTRGELGQAFLDALGTEGLKRTAADVRGGHYGRAALDLMGSGGIGGAATGGVLGGLIEGGRAALTPASGAVRNAAISAGRRVLTNGADSLSTREEIAEPAVEEAIRSGAIRPLGNNAGTYERLQGLSDASADRYRNIVSGLEQEGVSGPDARQIADQLMSRGATREMRTGSNKTVPNAYMNEAANAEAVANRESGRLGLTQAEDIKRALQKEARYGRVEETPLNEARRDIASVYRNATEQAVEQAGRASGEGSRVRALADQFVPAKHELGNLLTAEEAARRGFARGAQRSHLGPLEIATGLSEVAAGHPAAAIPATAGMKLLRGRGPSTVAAYGLRLSDALAPTAANNAGALGRGAALLQALKDRGVPVIDIPPPMMADKGGQ